MLLQCKFLCFTQLWKRDLSISVSQSGKYSCVNELITHLSVLVLNGQHSGVSVRAVAKIERRNGRGRSPWGNTGQVVYGGITLAGLDRANGFTYPKSEPVVERRVLNTRGFGGTGNRKGAVVCQAGLRNPSSSRQAGRERVGSIVRLLEAFF